MPCPPAATPAGAEEGRVGIRRAPLEELLVRQGIEPTLLEQAREQAEKAGTGLVEGLARTPGIDGTALARTLAEQTGLPLLERVDVDRVDSELVRKLPLGLARESGVLPLWEEEGAVLVAIASPSSLTSLDDLRLLYGRPVRPVIVSPTELRQATNQSYDKASQTAHAVMEDLNEEVVAETEDLQLAEDLLDDPNQAPIIRFVNSLLTQATKERASDIHIEPFEKELAVRFRVDGVLYEVVKPPPRLQASIVSRVKIMAGLNIAEKRIPQDGRIRTRMAGREIDIRVSTMPVRHGERVVMRLLEKGSVFSLDGVGMDPVTLAHFRKLIRLPHGIILVAGPTGSGKTTTLYSALSEINTPDKNILTIEDPVEYELRGIGQTQVNPKIDLTFASVLRAHLRQDPDIILVGETRDKETADNAVQASLTGHLVFSTIHTNSAPATFTRLIDMGVEPFLVASSLVAVLAQRLVRRLCEACKEEYRPSDEELRDVGIDPRQFTGPLWRARGCPECNNKGYRGRMGIYELLIVSERIRALVTAGRDAGAIRKQAIKEGMRTLRDDGIAKAIAGATSLDEVMRVTQDDVIELD
ncbi:MAG: type II secretion system protein GspE [Deltaproteobacteria bacterium]|nr:MAG: type II secretion system protein GspE [Deltaproteobacteria bacterium]